MKTRIVLIVALAVLAIIGLFFVKRPEAPRPQVAGKTKIVTTNAPIWVFTKNIALEDAEVVNLLPPGAESHDYAFSPRDLEVLQSADIVVFNGLGYDNW
ncbi:MAG: metal ABC transporter substrate-binding protein, partial [bacterium]